TVAMVVVMANTVNAAKIRRRIFMAIILSNRVNIFIARGESQVLISLPGYENECAIAHLVPARLPLQFQQEQRSSVRGWNHHPVSQSQRQKTMSHISPRRVI